MMERKPVMLLPSTSVRYGLAVSLTYVYIITFWILGINFVGEVEIYDVSMFPITRKLKILLANIAVHILLFVNPVKSQDDPSNLSSASWTVGSRCMGVKLICNM